MKKTLILTLVCILFATMAFAATTKAYTQKITGPDGLQIPGVVNPSTQTAPGFVVNAWIVARPGEVTSTTTHAASLIRLYRFGNGTSVPYDTRVFLQLSTYSTQWAMGDIIHVQIINNNVAPAVEDYWEVAIPDNSGAAWTVTVPVIMDLVPLADTWAYNLQVNGPSTTAFTGPQNGIMPQLLTAPDTDEENELLGVYTAAAAPAGFHWVMNPITVVPGMFTGAKVDHVYNAMIEFVLEADPDTYTYHLNVNGPVGGYAVTGPVAGTTDYMATDDVVGDLCGPYMIAAAPAGFHWVVNPIIVVPTDFVAAKSANVGLRLNNAKTDFHYYATITFVLEADPIVDTYTYNLYVNGPDGYAVTGPAAGVTDYMATDDVMADLLGDYTIAAPMPGYVWAVNPITVVAGDFVMAKTDFVYNATINFVMNMIPMDIDPIPLGDVPPGFPTENPNVAAYIVTWYGIHDVFIARGMEDTAAYLWNGTAWIAPTGSPDWTWLAVNFDGKGTVPVVIFGPPPAGYTFEVNAYDLNWYVGAGYSFPVPVPPYNDPNDLVAEILLNGVSFTPSVYTPYTFGLAGNEPFVVGTYSVVEAGYIGWLPTDITFMNITTNYAADFLGYRDDQVPVELSSFTATLTGQFYVQLTWVSQSETAMMGYRVYRSTTNDQSTSVMIEGGMIPATNSSTTQTYTVVDNDVQIGTTYYYWLEAVDYNTSAYHGPVSVTVEGNVPPVLPEVTTMRNAYPNPFKTDGVTTIEVALKAGEAGTVSIYNVLGQVVKTYSVTEGTHAINWNGKDSRGNTCGSGIYFYKLNTPSMNITKKMVIVK